MKFKLTVTFLKVIKLYNIKIDEKWSNFGIFFEFKIEVSEFISGVSLINSETGNIEVYLVLNVLSVTSLMKTIHFNKDKIF